MGLDFQGNQMASYGFTLVMGTNTFCYKICGKRNYRSNFTTITGRTYSRFETEAEVAKGPMGAKQQLKETSN
jgi:hypothetical protein